MRRNYSKERRNSSRTASLLIYYNVDLLHKYRQLKELTVNGVGTAIHMNPDTVRQVFRGTASHKQVWRVAEFLGADWAKLHDLSIHTDDELDRAVFSRKAVRSSGPARVGALQARSVKRGTYTRVER